MPERAGVLPCLGAGLVAACALVAAAPPATAGCGTIVLPSNVTFGPPNAPDSFHPVLSDGSFADWNAIFLMYRPLLWYRTGGGIDWSRSLAAHVAVDADDTRFTVTLRPWHWSDGVPVTSADMLYTWQLIRALGPVYVQYGLGDVPHGIASVTAPDAQTVVVTLRRSANPDWFMALGLVQLIPLPAHAWHRLTVAEQQSRQTDPRFFAPVDGPFRLASFAPGRDAVFEPNRRYEGHRPAYDRLVEDYLTSQDPLEALRADVVDAALLPPALDGAQVFAGARHVPLGPQGNLNTIIVNFRNRSVPFFDDARIRRAIASAIDQARLIRAVFAGHAVPQHGFVPTSDTDWLPPELRSGDAPLPFDPAHARLLLDEAGWHLPSDRGADGIRTDGRRRLEFEMLVDSTNNAAIAVAQFVEADLRRVGIAVDIKEMDFNQLVARGYGPHDGWQAMLLNWGSGSYPDATQWFGAGSTDNWGGFDDPEVNRLIARATGERGDAALWALERRIAALQPMIFLPDADPVLLARNDLDGLDKLADPSGEISPELLSWKGACDAPHA